MPLSMGGKGHQNIPLRSPTEKVQHLVRDGPRIQKNSGAHAAVRKLESSRSISDPGDLLRAVNNHDVTHNQLASAFASLKRGCAIHSYRSLLEWKKNIQPQHRLGPQKRALRRSCVTEHGPRTGNDHERENESSLRN